MHEKDRKTEISGNRSREIKDIPNIAVRALYSTYSRKNISIFRSVGIALSKRNNLFTRL
ncbi:MAG: hypothetical protein LBK06_10170 [Planctomycetaceae bacterium]|jgi:hypothetical protein|nr:hypothetical protein [Planctomycetaceae bacterium]